MTLPFALAGACATGLPRSRPSLVSAVPRPGLGRERVGTQRLEDALEPELALQSGVRVALGEVDELEAGLLFPLACR